MKIKIECERKESSDFIMKSPRVYLDGWRNNLKGNSNFFS